MTWKERYYDGQEDFNVLSSLQGLKCAQARIRRARASRDEKAVRAALRDIARYYRELPEPLARRLTEISPDTIAEAEKVVIKGDVGFAGSFSGDEAIAQVIRAANTYRKKLEYAPLGPDGWPVKEDS